MDVLIILSSLWGHHVNLLWLPEQSVQTGWLEQQQFIFLQVLEKSEVVVLTGLISPVASPVGSSRLTVLSFYLLLLFPGCLS